MTHTHHPSNKFQRKVIAEKKHLYTDEKKVQKERAAKVWRKRTVEQIKEQEAEHELVEYST